MLIVADSSPLIVLIEIGHIEILRDLFIEVIVPPQVLDELRSSRRPKPIRDFVRSLPQWISERAPSVVEPIPHLHPGESAAIALATELNADLLLIDELEGRRVAFERRIPLTGTIGVLELAADRRLLDLRQAFERVKASSFWISERLLDQRLRQREIDPG